MHTTLVSAAAAPPAAVLPAGQCCFVRHRKCTRQRAQVLRPSAAARSQQGMAAEQPAAAEQQPCGNRRQLLCAAGLLAAAPAISWPVAAEEQAASSSVRRVFFDITVDRKPFGRIVIEVAPSAPAIGGQRFLDLTQGKEGVAFRKTKFELLEDAFIQNSGLKALSRQASGQTAITGGPDTEQLEEELAAQAAAGGTAHNAPGLVSLLVKPRIEITAKDKLVAQGGKLITVTETFGEIPNGSAWAITTQAAPELDATNLVVGRVVEGMDVVQAIAALPRVKDNSSSPFFIAGKVAGDKRADVAERSFKKPFNKIVVNECGLL